MMEELIKRLGALAFAAVYTAKHGNTRAGALRVASHAYKFLDGEDVTLINQEADAADTIREAGTKQPKPQKFPKKTLISTIRRLTKYVH
jgi:hypothetical protein